MEKTNTLLNPIFSHHNHKYTTSKQIHANIKKKKLCPTLYQTGERIYRLKVWEYQCTYIFTRKLKRIQQIGLSFALFVYKMIVF